MNTEVFVSNDEEAGRAVLTHMKNIIFKYDGVVWANDEWGSWTCKRMDVKYIIKYYLYCRTKLKHIGITKPTEKAIIDKVIQLAPQGRMTFTPE